MHEDTIHRIGQFYGFHDDIGEKDVFILARSGRSKVVLISLCDGNRWAPPVHVADPTNITPEEFARVSNPENAEHGRFLRVLSVRLHD